MSFILGYERKRSEGAISLIRERLVRSAGRFITSNEREKKTVSVFAAEICGKKPKSRLSEPSSSFSSARAAESDVHLSVKKAQFFPEKLSNICLINKKFVPKLRGLTCCEQKHDE